MSIQIKKKFIKSQVIDGTKVLFLNEDSFKALNSQGEATELFKLSSGDKLVMLQMPQVSSDPVADEDLARKKYVDDSLEVEMLAREAGDETLSEDLATETAAREAEDLTFLKHDGSRPMSGSLDMGTNDITSVERVSGPALVGLTLDGMGGNVSVDAPQLSLTSGTLSIQGAILGEFEGDLRAFQSITMSGYGVRNLADGVNASDAVNKGQLDSAVSGINSDISDVESALAAETAAREAADSALSQDISDEEARAMAAEGVLQGNIDAEESARIAADSALQSEVDAEEARALAAEGVLQGNIDAEQAARIAAVSAEETARIAGDNALSDRLDVLEADAVTKTYVDAADAALQSEVDAVETALAQEVLDRTADVDAEEARALAAEGVLQSAIDAEESRAMAAESTLQSNIDVEKNRIDAILLASDADKDSFAEIVALINSVDTENDNAFASYVLSNDAALAAEVAARESADSALSQDISDEEARAMAAEAALQGAIDAEESRAMAAEGVLTSDLAAEVARATAAEGVLQSNIDAEEAARIAAVSAEQAAREAADAQLTSDLAAEVARATAAEGVLQDNIDAEEAARIAAVSAEETARIAGDDALSDRLDVLEADAVTKAYVDAADLVLQTAIDDEEARAMAAESTLQSNITAEETARIAGDAALQTAIDDEEARALAAEGVLASDIVAEETRAMAAEATLQSNITAEETARIAGDTTLQSNIDAEESRAVAAEGVLQSNIDAEEARAMAAEGVLQSNIDVEKGRIDAILLAADADKDSFAEIVALINSVDTENDSAFAAYVLSNDAALAAEEAAREAADAAIDTRLDALEANNYVFAKESFTLTSGDLVYIDLGYEVEANSICAFVDRLGLHKDEDFTVSVVGGVTRLTWAGSVMTGGDEELAVGDKIKVTYARRV